MRYGLTNLEIVEAFSGAISGDFEEVVSDADAIIDREIEIQSAKLDSYLPRFVFKTLRTATEILTPDDNLMITPSLPVDGDLVIRYFERGVCETTCSGSLEYVDNGDGTYTLTTSQDVLVTYDVDEDQLVDCNLKGLLRDLVACSLGRKLFPSGSETWDIVRFYCESAKDMLDIIRKDKTWLPASMIGMRFYRSLFASADLLRG